MTHSHLSASWTDAHLGLASSPSPTHRARHLEEDLGGTGSPGKVAGVGFRHESVWTSDASVLLLVASCY